jgi:hypothetical protein
LRGGAAGESEHEGKAEQSEKFHSEYLRWGRASTASSQITDLLSHG